MFAAAELQSFSEHFDVITMLLTGCVLIIWWGLKEWFKFQRESIAKRDEVFFSELKRMHERIDSLAADLYSLKGAHAANH